MKKTLILVILTWLIHTKNVAQNLDSLWLVWQDVTQPDTNRLKALQIYSWEGYLFTQPDSAYYFSMLQYNYAKTKDLKKYTAAALNTIGTSFSIRGEYNDALKNYIECLGIKKELGDFPGVGMTYNSIGNVYRNLSDFPKALDYYFKSLKIIEKFDDKYDLGLVLGNIGAVYADQSDYTMALEYYLKDLKISQEIGYELGESITLSNIGALYDTQKDYIKALEYYFQSLEIAEKIDDKLGIGITRGNIGNVYKALLDYTKALEYYFQSLQIYEEIGDAQGIGIINGSMGELYTKIGKFKEAEFHLKKGLKICQEIGASNFEKDFHSYLSVLYEKTNQPSEALEHYKSYVLLRDSIYSEENSKEILSKELNHEYEKQKVADSIVNAEAEKVHKANLEAEKAKGAQQQTEIAAQKKQNMFLFIGLGLVALFGFFMYNRFKVTQKQKGIIENQKQEVEIQKVKVESTLNELESTYQKLESIHEQLEESHKEITDSINYAERIQRSFLATKELLDDNLGVTSDVSQQREVSKSDPDYFVFFKPKDVVSGDFYFASQLKNNRFALCCADSTGHGVPGAIMSILNISSLEKAIEKETEPHHILGKTRELIIERLKKDGSPEGGKDGMDCSLLVLNQDKTQLTFASANNPVFIVRKNSEPQTPNLELIEFKSDKMPVGKHDKDQTPFTLQTVSLQKGDIIYTLTDGMPDQFGGEKGKKYMIKNLKNLFLTIAHLPMNEQYAKLDEEFTIWRGENEQVDDVCIIGVRIS